MLYKSMRPSGPKKETLKASLMWRNIYLGNLTIITVIPEHQCWAKLGGLAQLCCLWSHQEQGAWLSRLLPAWNHVKASFLAMAWFSALLDLRPGERSGHQVSVLLILWVLEMCWEKRAWNLSLPLKRCCALAQSIPWFGGPQKVHGFLIRVFGMWNLAFV